MTGPLSDLKVLDLSRILAGPSATQILGDFGADVVKIERPGVGDDTRRWGPPYVAAGSTESAYYVSCNRNKRSVELDFTTEDGRATLKKLIQKADVLIENFRVGTLARYGLGYEDVKDLNPGLIYCSFTGFGATGPYKDRAGYDVMIQAMGGITSLTGPADGPPHKVGVAIADLMGGMYALSGILAALHHRDKTGEGQFIDLGLLDTQVAWLSNAGQYYLTTGEVTPRMGNAHPMIVPYEVFEAKDGFIVLAVGNDGQFERFCAFAGRTNLAKDERFATNASRVAHRNILVPIIQDIIRQQTCVHWLEGLEQAKVACGPVNNLDQVFADPQIKARDMTVAMPHPDTDKPVTLIANPLKFSKTPVSYRQAPPKLGADTQAVLAEWLED